MMTAIPDIITLGSDIVSKSQQGVQSVRACEQLARLIRGLVGVLLRFQEADVLNDADDAQHLFKSMESHLEHARKQVERACVVPAMYRTIMAFPLSAEFRKVCHNLGITMESLDSLLTHKQGGMAQAVRGDVRRLEMGFRKANFPLEKRELRIFNEARRVSHRVFRGEILAMNGVALLHDLLESTLGAEKIKHEWKQVAEQLLHDMDAARSKKDREEEHYARMLFWAVAGRDTPPPEYYCPISLELMEDPVVLIETAVTYDKKSIDTWLFAYGSTKCPVSGMKLNRLGYVENKALRCLIDDWKREHMHEEASEGELEFSVTSLSDKCMNYLGPDGVERDLESLAGTLPVSGGQGMDSLTEWFGENEDTPMAWGFGLGKYLSAIKENAFSVGMQLGRRTTTSTTKYDDAVSRVDLSPMDTTQEASERSDNPKSEGSLPSGSHLPQAQSDMKTFRRIEAGHPGGGDPRSGRRRITLREAIRDMHMACQNGNAGVLTELIEDGYRLDTADADGRTCLHCAVAHGQLPIVTFLLENGVSINATTKNDFSTPLYMAACTGHANIVRCLLKNGANIMISNKNGWSPLHAAADLGHVEVVNELLHHAEAGRLRTYPTIATEAGWTVLHHAARSGNLESLELLLPYFNDVNQKCNVGYTALHVAVDNSLKDVVMHLLGARADPNAQSKDGWTPLHVAQDKNDLEIGRMLLDYGANPDVTGQDGVTALHRAAFQNHLEFSKLLVDVGHADLSKRTMPKGEPGRKAIQIASDYNHHEIYNLLFRRGLKRMFRKG
ncbi:hypothetical protein BSKO_05343 [Bryopsis sp. KO-2023]|nr:hypothetical protein BSKO_05343 [Bryopsis sp. KO-2023]